MEKKNGYGAKDIAGDLTRLGEEIGADTERTLCETHPRNFDHDEWKTMRSAIETMRTILDNMEEAIDRAEDEAGAYDEEVDEGRYESFWE